MKVGLLNADGYVPGLNAVIYGILLKASESGIACIGIKNGWMGFIKNIKEPLHIANLDKLHKIGGTLISTSKYKTPIFMFSTVYSIILTVSFLK
jgi:6-phosphofructokinase 1